MIPHGTADRLNAELQAYVRRLEVMTDALEAGEPLREELRSTVVAELRERIKQMRLAKIA